MKTPPGAIPQPPALLLTPCIEPVEGGALAYFMQGEYEKAADAHVRYVLDVRDAFEICNSKFAALRQYYKEVSR